MPFKDAQAKKQHDADRRARIAADPVLLEKRRKSTREAQARRMQDSSLKVVQAQRCAEWRRKNISYRAEWGLKQKYGMTIAQYWKLFDAQGGVCAICRLPESLNDPRYNRPRRLAVDHCHETGEIRGLLCFKCNCAMGKFNDDPGLLKAAIRYLEFHATR